MAQEFEIINANSLPAATNITDNDMILIIQGSGPKRALPSAMKGKPGDPGLSVYLGVTSANIQWKQGATGVWQSLIELEKIRGPKGEKPLFRKVGGTLQMKYEGQPDTAYVSLFDREELKMKFSDLTAAEVDKLKLHFSDLTNEDKAELMKPATDAATEVRAEMAQISTEAGQVIEATNTAKGNAETATTAANQAASAANTAASLANTAVEETETATGLALSAATLAEKKAGLANTAAQGATTAKENAETATTEATEAALAADTAAGLATTAATDATAAKDAAVLAARNAQEAADNVQDGKTPQLGIGTVESGSEASATVAAAGSDESGNPKYTLSFVLPQGEEGKAPVIEVGTITTGEPGTGASAELVSNGQTTEGNPKYLFNLSVPRGNQGLPGTGSGNVLVSENGLVAGKQYMFVPSEDGRSEGSFIEYIAPDIPSKTTDLTNDSGFITKAVSDLTNYYPKNQIYTKSDTYTKSETDSAINTKLAGVYKVKGSVSNYAALPTTNVAVGDVYNVLDTGANYVATATTPTWDKLSETIDLSAYSTTAQANAKYVKKAGDAMTSTLYTPAIRLTSTSGIIQDGHASSMLYANGMDTVVGAAGGKTTVRGNNTDLVHLKNGTEYKIWDASNDGAGSGLDADTVDGVEAVSILQNFYLAGEVDLNTVTKSGAYRVTNATNGPSEAHDYAQMLVIHGGADTIAQMTFGYSAKFNHVHVRSGNPPVVGGNGVWNPWKMLAYTTDNVASATKLQTVRKLWGLNFDGTQDTIGLLTVSSNGVISKFGQQNASFCHFDTNAPLGFHFSTTIQSAGSILPYTASGNFTIGNSDAKWSGIYLDGNVTTYGNSGWHNATWDGGMDMIDGNFVRVSKAKALKIENTTYDALRVGGGVHCPIGRDNMWGAGFGAISVLSGRETGQTPLIVLASDTAGILGTTPTTRYFSMEVLNDGSIMRFNHNGSAKMTVDMLNSVVIATNFKGMATSAGKLATTRTINGVAFDGTSNITVTAAANGGTSAACSGNASTATKLQTARTIQGVPFDGTANITLPVATASANGLMTAAHYKRLELDSTMYNLTNSLTVTPQNSNNFIVSLSSNASISVSGSVAYPGQELFIVVNPTAAVTITIPTAGSFVSMCGSSYTCTAGKQVEFSLKCVDSRWRIAKLEQE